jgi:hypothetical protein
LDPDPCALIEVPAWRRDTPHAAFYSLREPSFSLTLAITFGTNFLKNEADRGLFYDGAGER